MLRLWQRLEMLSDFVMEHEQMTYPEALRWLAKKYNIEIKERELTDEENKYKYTGKSLCCQ